jgi:CheY-like chemotaxis protein/predicted Ser/Thr protein kinase
MALFKKKRAEGDPDATRVGGVVVRPPLAGGDLEAGTEIGAYRVQSTLGRGGMGVVYRAEHIHLGRPVALKVLAPGLAGDFRERFVRESRIAASLSHPNIVTVYDAGDERGVPWIAMQLIEGTDLRQLVTEDGPRDSEQVVNITGQVASALDAAHAAGLVHRDVKPGNILLNGAHAWLSDFGLTKRLSSRTDLTAASDIVGTPDYLAPEQIEGGAVTGRVDQYALACVVHHALVGTPPFEGESDIAVMQAHLTTAAPRVSEARPELPAEVDEVLSRAMAKDPGERFPATSDFADALATALGVDDAPVHPARGRAESGYVLVGVEDPSTRAVIRAALGRTADLTEVADAEALQRCAYETAPGLVLLDISLPDAEPSELVRTLRDAVPDRLPIVALAERGRDSQWRDALEAGADDVLLRPFSAFQLLAKVRDHMPRALER